MGFGDNSRPDGSPRHEYAHGLARPLNPNFNKFTGCTTRCQPFQSPGVKDPLPAVTDQLIPRFDARSGPWRVIYQL